MSPIIKFSYVTSRIPGWMFSPDISAGAGSCGILGRRAAMISLVNGYDGEDFPATKLAECLKGS